MASSIEACAGVALGRDGEERNVLRRYAIALWACATLFSLRVLGQALVAFPDVAFLPPMAAWYSGLIPYPLLLPIQLVILALQIRVGLDLWRGAGFFVVPRPGMGRALRRLSVVYFAAMLLRYLITGRLIIPILFHWVLAANLFILGHYHATYRLARREPA
ncbi:MAG: hypothetical protein L0191_11085 [Acidobacteria bacterium]|nr:hypothetical protein [Acidobacteriota bacterium]